MNLTYEWQYSYLGLNQPVNYQLLIAHNPKMSLLPFLGGLLSWLTGTASTEDMTETKGQINLLIQKQTKQQETLVHIISIHSYHST